jgi:hypothetical protein
MNNYDVNVSMIIFVALLGAILTTSVVLGMQVLYYRYEAGVETSPKFSEPEVKLQKLQAEQRAQLTEYRLLDAKKGIVAIPIDRAMELVVAALPHPKADGVERRSKQKKGGFT